MTRLQNLQTAYMNVSGRNDYAGAELTHNGHCNIIDSLERQFCEQDR